MSKRKKSKKSQSIVHVTTGHTGKMKGINSLSTSCLTCGRCAKYASVKGSICEHCFAKTTQERYKDLAVHLANNSITLNDHIFTSEEIASIPVVGEVFRFEAFGDLQSVTQAINYINIARANRKTTFALWTKNPDILAAAVKAGYKIPKNMCIGLSSLFTDLPYNEKGLDHWKQYFHIDFVFTVYTADYALEHNITINCGANDCNGCRRCYTRHKHTMYVNEMLKSQSKKYYRELEKRKKKAA